MKACRKCQIEKDIDHFYKRNRSIDGHYHICKECAKEESRQQHLKNPEAHRVRAKAWVLKNPIKKTESDKAWVSANRDKVNANHRDYYQRTKDLQRQWSRKKYLKNAIEKSRKSRARIMANPEKYREMSRRWYQANKHVVVANKARRRAAKIKATPAWANKRYIRLWYLVAKLEAERTGRPCHVDHIVPLRSNMVCGLHCEHNLQILFDVDNRRKGNYQWPEMP